MDGPYLVSQYMTCTFYDGLLQKGETRNLLFRVGEKVSKLKKNVFTKFKTAFRFPEFLVYSLSMGNVSEFHLYHDKQCILVKAQDFLKLFYCFNR